MKQLITTLALLLAINIAGISTASAAIKVYVKNCSDKRMTIGATNPKDSIGVVFYQSRTFGSGDSKSLKCQGQGKGYCKVSVKSSRDCEEQDVLGTKVDKNKWIKVLGCNDFEKDLSSEPSCD